MITIFIYVICKQCKLYIVIYCWWINSRYISYNLMSVFIRKLITYALYYYIILWKSKLLFMGTHKIEIGLPVSLNIQRRTVSRPRRTHAHTYYIYVYILYIMKHTYNTHILYIYIRHINIHNNSVFFTAEKYANVLDNGIYIYNIYKLIHGYYLYLYA